MKDLIPYLLLICFAIILFVYIKTAKSAMAKDRKIALYVTTIVSPVIGLIPYFVFKKANQRESSTISI